MASTDAPPVFITLYDAVFAARGLVMLASLERCMPDLDRGGATVVVIALDETAMKATSNWGMGKPWLDVVGLEALAEFTEGLIELRRSRSPASFCWTLSPLALRLGLARGAPIAIYVDADLLFHTDPLPTLRRLLSATASVHITPHGFPSWADHSAVAGRFCVQFLPVRNDPVGRDIMVRWSEQCLARCPDTPANGEKLGDQGHLDEWPALHGNAVAVWDETGVGCGPWNRCLNRLRRCRTGLEVSRAQGQWAPLLFVHHQDVKYDCTGRLSLAHLLSWPLDAVWLRFSTLPYLAAVAAAHRRWLPAQRHTATSRPPLGFWPRWLRDRLTHRGEGGSAIGQTEIP